MAVFKGKVGDLTAKDAKSAKEEMAGKGDAKSREKTRRGEKKVGGRARISRMREGKCEWRREFGRELNEAGQARKLKRNVGSWT